jgi:mannose-6-phosphate isomerase-like protein (cupin superfamily)
MEPIVLTETDGESYAAGALRLRPLAQSPEQPIAVTESAVPPGFPGPVRHRHARMTDVFSVLEGELTFDLPGEQRILGAGAFVLVPPGVAHTFANPGLGAGPGPEHPAAGRPRAVPQGRLQADGRRQPLDTRRDGRDRRRLRLRVGPRAGLQRRPVPAETPRAGGSAPGTSITVTGLRRQHAWSR